MSVTNPDGDENFRARIGLLIEQPRRSSQEMTNTRRIKIASSILFGQIGSFTIGTAVARLLLMPELFENCAYAGPRWETIHCVPLGVLAVGGDDFFLRSEPPTKLRWLPPEPHDEVASACTGIFHRHKFVAHA